MLTAASNENHPIRTKPWEFMVSALTHAAWFGASEMLALTRKHRNSCDVALTNANRRFKREPSDPHQTMGIHGFCFDSCGFV
jgi:hypothetical protein